MSLSGLIAKQERFCEQYLLDLNATQAAIRSGYSSRSASELGYQLLQDPSVRDEITRQMAERSQRTAINQDSVVNELTSVALFDPGQLFDASGKLMPIEAAPEASRRAISCFRVVETRGDSLVTEVRFWNKVKALELLGRHLGMFGSHGSRRHHQIDIAAKLRDNTERERRLRGQYEEKMIQDAQTD